MKQFKILIVLDWPKDSDNQLVRNVHIVIITISQQTEKKYQDIQKAKKITIKATLRHKSKSCWFKAKYKEMRGKSEYLHRTLRDAASHI